MSAKDFRLSRDIRPSNYDISFDVNLEKSTFSGKETIDLQITKPTSKIILHSVDLKIKGASLLINYKSIGGKIKVEKNETVTLTLPSRVKGNVKLSLDFSGELNDNLLGFYRSKYVENGKDKYLATTQFEAHYARRAFPCFDEPECKATFDVSIRVAKNLKAISNMPVKEELDDGDTKIVKFDRTPRMSTYLLYLGVGDFEFLEDKLGDVTIRFASVPGKSHQGKLAIDFAKKFLSYFQDYSDIPYPLPKLDLIALPDFIVGAMENWGAITFRELYLLFDPKMTSTTVKKRMAMIIAHELWHQWSGDLVTMKWWNDLWLNESFATFMAYKAVHHFYPEWDMWEEFIRDETDRAFDDDSLRTTHPIEVEVKNPHQIEELFDAISYSKGGSILRMIESYLGDETFRKGVSNYLSENRYNNAASEDLWNSLAKISNKPIKQVTSSWIRQSGYPIIDSRMENRSLTLRQNRFVFNHNDKTTWPIPLIIKTDNDMVIELLEKKEKKLLFDKQPKWIKLNYGQSGFYRVKYSKENLSILGDLISNNGISPIDRWGLQNDLFKISKNEELSIENYLDFIKSYGKEENYLVLGSIYSNLRNIYFVFSQESFWSRIWPNFRNHFKSPFRRILNKLGWEPKPDELQRDSLLRELCIRYLAFVEDSEVLHIGKEKFSDYLKGETGLHPDIKSPVFLMVAANGDEKIYEKLLALYSKSQSPEEKRLVLLSIGQFRDPKILRKALDFTLSPKFRVQDLPIVFSSVAYNPHSRKILFDWVKTNWKRLETYKKSGSIFLHIIESFTSAYVAKNDERELRKFFVARPLEYKMTLDRSFERMKRNIYWLNNNKSILSQYFS